MSAAASLIIHLHATAKRCARVIHTVCILRLGIINFLKTSTGTLLQANRRHDKASGDCPPPLLSIKQCRPRATGDNKKTQIALVKQPIMSGRHRTIPASHFV
eukprot:scaffold285149_cov17-Prasinocladus_malaysianus.AAC.1